MDKLNDIIFYQLDKAIKTYRQFAQQQLKKTRLNLTIDQWLVLKTIYDTPGISQRDIAAFVFKDEASVTRIIELLVKKDLLSRNFHPVDRRKVELTANKSTKLLLEKIHHVILKNRDIALNGIDPSDLEITKRVLINISANCSKQ